MRSRVKVLRKHDLCNMALASIRGKDVASYIKDREDDGKSSQTVLHEINLVSRVVEISRKDWGMESLQNPTKRVNKPKLLDIQLPGMDGIEVAQKISNDLKLQATSIPIIAMTAYAMTGDKEHFLASGMDGYLAKPLEIKLLRKELCSVLCPKDARR